MKARKAMALMMASAMAVSMAACGSDDAGTTAADTTAAETTEAAEDTTAAEEGETTEAAEEETTGEETEIKEVVFPETVNNGEEVTLSFAWWGAQTRHERTQQVVNMFMEKYPNVHIECEPYDFDGYFQKMATLVGANDVWDVFQLGNNWAEYESVIVDLTPYIEDGTINTENMTDSELATTREGDKQMEISLGTNAHCIIYNADMFAEAGLEEPAENWTWADYEEYAEKLKEVTGEFGSSSLEEFYGACTVGVPQMEAGLNFFKDDNSGLEIDKPDYMVPFIEMIQRMTESGAYPDRGALNEIGTNPEQNFVATGEAAMTWALSNQVVAMQTAAEQNGVGQLKVATLPRYTEDGPSGYALKSSQGLAISTSCENPDVAAEFINFFINSNEANEILLGERGVPVSSAVRAAIEDKLTETEQIVFDYIDEVGKFEDTGVNINEPTEQAKIKDQFKIELEKVISGEQDAQTAAQNVFDYANDAFERGAQEAE